MPAGPTEARPEGAARGRRKLAAILSADAVGFSRRMHEDETGTLARLRSCRGIIDRLVAEHDGRVVGSAGDSVLADFPSIVEALPAPPTSSGPCASATPPSRRSTGSSSASASTSAT